METGIGRLTFCFLYDSEEFETTGKIEDKVFWDNYGDLSEENRVYWENYSTCSEQIPEFTEPMAFFGTGDNFSEAVSTLIP